MEKGTEVEGPVTVGMVTLANADQAAAKIEEWGMAQFAYLFVTHQILL